MRALLSVLAVACLAGSAQAQQPTKPPPKQQQPQTVRCIKDSFNNVTCTDGTRVIHDSFDNAIVIPGREQRVR